MPKRPVVYMSKGQKLQNMALLILVAAAVGIAAGWIATLVAARFAPFIIFPLAVGATIGLLLIGARTVAVSAAKKDTTHKTPILATAILASLIAVAAQHYFNYIESQREIAKSQTVADAKRAFADVMQERLPSGLLEYLQAQAAIGRRMPLGYVAQGPMAWLTWALDGLLVVAGAVGVVTFVQSAKVSAAKPR